MNGLLVGYGSIGRRHLGNFMALGVLDWAVVHTDQGALPFEPPRPVRSYGSLEAALDREPPGFAVIANPTSLHVASAQACAERGWHILIEKPVSDSLDGVDQLAKTIAAREVKLLVGFQFRFHPALRLVRDHLDEGRIGIPLHAEVVWGEFLPSMHPWEDWRKGYAARRDLGGGVHHTLSHPFDYLAMLLGRGSPVTASFTTNGPLGLDVAESADVLLRYPDGVDVDVHLDYWSRPSRHRLEIVGTEGTIRWDILEGELRIWTAVAQEWQAISVDGLDRRAELFVAEAKHFLDVLDGREEPICDLGMGADMVRLCQEIERLAGT